MFVHSLLPLLLCVSSESMSSTFILHLCGGLKAKVGLIKKLMRPGTKNGPMRRKSNATRKMQWCIIHIHIYTYIHIMNSKIFWKDFSGNLNIPYIFHCFPVKCVFSSGCDLILRRLLLLHLLRASPEWGISWLSRQTVNENVIETKDCGLYANMLIQHSFTNLGASPPQNESKPPKTNPKNLGTFTPILEVRTLIAKAIWGKIVDVSCLRKRNKNSWSIKYLSYLRNKVSGKPSNSNNQRLIAWLPLAVTLYFSQSFFASSAIWALYLAKRGGYRLEIVR